MKSAFSSWNLRKNHCASFIRTNGVLLEVCSRKDECCAWSLVAITSHILALKLTASLRLLIRSLSLFVSNPCLTSLHSGCISFTPNQVYSLVCIYHRAMSLWFSQVPSHNHVALLVLVYRGFEQVPYMVPVHFRVMLS
jgi:hypothetical protein